MLVALDTNILAYAEGVGDAPRCLTMFFKSDDKIEDWAEDGSQPIQFRGQKVILDRDPDELYNVETRVLKQAVRRNIQRFLLDSQLAE